MSSSPSCSSASTNATDLQDAFSDDSGVDLKPQIARDSEANKRNKRKSSEPKKRRDVLLMKRFRWDSDEEEDVFDVLERERPSSGDSGCQLDSSVRATDKRKRQWRKPKAEAILTPFRQSVICKNETTCTGISAPLHQDVSPSSTKEAPNNPPAGPSQNLDAVLDEDDARSNRGARPRAYKNMSRQRRIEANARERTRVHTISAAFESLRRAVPAYAHNQKLSKLAILRIASAYIVALACLNGQPEGSPPSMAECVEKCTRTIQAEGRSRRRTSKD